MSYLIQSYYPPWQVAFTVACDIYVALIHNFSAAAVLVKIIF